MKHCNIVFAKSDFAFQFTKGCKETCECPEEPAGQMRPHWGKVLRRGPWTGEKVCSPLPAPFWQSMSFTRIFTVAFPDTKAVKWIWKKNEGRIFRVMVISFWAQKMFLTLETLNLLLFILICNLPHALLWKEESSPTVFWEEESVCNIQLSPYADHFPECFFPVINAGSQRIMCH